MTTTENGQRDELASEIAGHHIGDGYYSAIVNMGEAREIADDILAAGYRKLRIITTVEELDALPDGAVIIDSDPAPCEKINDHWFMPGSEMRCGDAKVNFPATVLYVPEAEVGA